MTSTTGTTSSAASAASSRRTGRGCRSRRPQLSPAHREAADAARAAKIAALLDQISELVEQLTANPHWRAMLEAAAKFHSYSLNNQLLLMLQAARLRITPAGVAGFTSARVGVCLPPCGQGSVVRLVPRSTIDAPRVPSYLQPVQ